MNELNLDYFGHHWDSSVIEEVKKLKGPILVVGASGFIGSRLFHSLISVRDDVFAISKLILSSWRMAHLPKTILRNNLENIDITNIPTLEPFLSNLNPGTVFNLSAYGAYERQSDIARIHSVNYIGTLNLLTILAERGLNAFVHTGSSSEYGLNCAGPSEGDRLQPNSHYAVSKVGASYLIGYYGSFLNVPAVNLRLYSVYGPFEERDRLIPKVISAGLQGRYPALAGKDISRDFIYVDDCTAALVRAANSACQTDPGHSINICSGIKTTLSDVAAAAKDIFSLAAEPEFASMPNRKWDLSNWYGKPHLAQKLLGWTATTSLREGLLLTKEWETKNLSRISQSVVPLKQKKVTAIIACYRDNQAIPIMHERLRRVFLDMDYEYEIIFVNDGSPADDEQAILAVSARDPNVLGVTHSRNFGSQSAFISGMSVATGDAVILLDGDLQDPPELITEFVKKWEEGFDVVYGIRVQREAKPHMQILYKLFYRIFRFLADVTIPVDAGDFSLIDRKVFEQLLKFHERDVFIRGLRAWVGFKQTGVPYVRPERMFGVTTNSFRKNIWWAKKAIFSFSMKPLEYIQRTGLLIFMASFSLAAFYLVYYFINPPVGSPGITTIILLVLLLSGIQILCLSIVGDYIGKILEEVKNRPKFIQSRMIKLGQVLPPSEWNKINM